MTRSLFLSLALALALPLALPLTAVAQKAVAPKKEAGKPVQIRVPPLPPSTEDGLQADLATVKFVPHDQLGKGVESALIGADPMSTGPTGYLKLAGGAKIAEHWATHNVQYLLITGKGHFTVAGKTRAVAPGSFTIVTSKTRQAIACDPGAPCIYLVRHMGPPDVNFVAGSK